GHARAGHRRPCPARGRVQGRPRARRPPGAQPPDCAAAAGAGWRRMNLFAAIRTALRALRKNKLRSFLAALGIVIAVGAVVATVAIGQGAQAKVAAQMASLGSNLLMVMPGSISQHGAATGAGATQNLTRDDAQSIEKELASSVGAIAPMNRSGAQVIY